MGKAEQGASPEILASESGRHHSAGWQRRGRGDVSVGVPTPLALLGAVTASVGEGILTQELASPVEGVSRLSEPEAFGLDIWLPVSPELRGATRIRAVFESSRTP